MNLDDVKDSIGFGLPLIPHTIGAMVINMSDRLFITHYLNKEILGIYNIGYLAGSVLSLINAGFANAIVPFSYELFNQNTTVAKGKVVKVYWMYILILIVFILLIWLLTPFMFNHFIDKKFHGGTRFVVWIALGYFFQGIYLLFANIIFYLKKTKVLFYLSFFNIAINLTLNYLLVPRFGAMGAAYTLCISYFIFVVAVAFYCFRNFPLPWLTFNRKR
ncbi:polysaccharide biosynthesis C-terminal domain-containing protein [Niabella sp. W65]|nr:polysaccharide biosynthesis C-terminal domain-containing protein [Niabella sp. W65]MCH7365034.1 polysaccharide biosynthesis C-terminal domain-containing protein [Niabella sp. W65]ULT40848.1 polysaccharide biosynthesis C-terminal domain-containing protein [Niabella sp. I65]